MKPAIVLWLLVAAGVAHAAPLIDEPVAELRLNSGKVLSQAIAKSYTPTTVFVKHAGGGASVKYEEFPAEYTAALTAKRPAPPTAAELSVREAKAEALKNAEREKIAAAKKAIDKRTLRGGVRLSRTEATPQRTIFKLWLHNETAEPKRILASELIAETGSGRTHKGSDFRINYSAESFSIDLPGNSQTEVDIIFSGVTREDGGINTVRWEK